MSDNKKSDRLTGFEEAPQAPFKGAPLAGDIASWAEEIAAESEASPQAVAQEAEKKSRNSNAAKPKAKTKKAKKKRKNDDDN